MGNREDLLAGARRCLADKGYGRTTVRDIAKAAGVSMAAIGYHFGSREALLNEALFQALDELGTETGRALDTASPPTPEAFERSWAGLLESVDDHPELWMASLEAYVQAQHTPELREQMAEGQQQGRSGIVAHLLQVDESTLDEATIRTLGSVMSALTSGIALQRLSDPDRAPAPAEIMTGIRKLAELTGHVPRT